jgi:hypothetical protein
MESQKADHRGDAGVVRRVEPQHRAQIDAREASAQSRMHRQQRHGERQRVDRQVQQIGRLRTTGPATAGRTGKAEQRGHQPEHKVHRHGADEVQLRRADLHEERLHAQREEQRRQRAAQQQRGLPQRNSTPPRIPM